MIKAVLRCDSWEANKVISYLTKTKMESDVEIVSCRNWFDSDYTKITIKVTDNSVLNEILNNINNNSNKPVLLISKRKTKR